MKIALPSRENMIDDHFGHCEYYTIFTINDQNEIVSRETLQSPAGCGCKSNIAQTLSSIGVNVMLAGNMGQGAMNVLNSNGIEVLRGCKGNVQIVTDSWLKGDLKDSGDICEQHEHGCHN